MSKNKKEKDKDKKEKENGKGSLLKKIVPIIALIIILGAVFAVMNSDTFKFGNFNGPEYVPAHYNNTDKFTNDNERIFEYTGNGTFWVAVIKNTSDKQLKTLLNPFENDKNYTNITKENITINGHQVLFEVHSMEVNLGEMASSIPALSKYAIPNQSFSKFQAKWHCEESNLTFVSTGFVYTSQIPEMKKTTQSIKCHNEKQFVFF